MKAFSLFPLSIMRVLSETCNLPIDVMILQDTTGSLLKNLPQMLEQVSLLKEEIEGMYPGTHFGVAEFQDKPYFPLGESDSFCYKLAGPLTNELSNFTQAYGGLYGSGGGDQNEDHFQAIINVVLDPAVGWRSFSLAPNGLPSPGSTGGRFIVMVTDGLPHVAGDVAKFADLYPQVPRDLPANAGDVVDGDVTFSCLYQDYPSATQVKNVLEKYSVHLITLTPHLPNITQSWQWVNTNLLGQPESFYRFIKQDSTDFHESIVEALSNVSFPVPCPTEYPSTR